jgi:YD repeat-containing protein
MNRAAIMTALALACLFAAQAPAQGEDVKYFRHVTLDGKHAIVGKYEVAEEEATGVNCYRFVYDESDGPVEISYLKGGRMSPGSYFGESVACVKITYGPNFERRSYYNAAGTLVPDDDEVFSKAYKLDDNGYRVAMTNYDFRGVKAHDRWLVARYEWEVDARGRHTTEKRFDRVGIQVEDRLERYESRYEYGAGDYPTRVTHYDCDGKLCEDSAGTGAEGLSYDGNGNLVEARYFGEKGKLQCPRGIIPSYEFWDYFVTRRRDLGFAIERRAYDAVGNVTAYSFFDEKENPAEREDTGVAVERTAYDERGNPVEISYYGKNGKPTRSKLLGVCAVKYSYDPYGNPVTTEYCDGKGRPTDRSDYDCAAIHTSYDDAGNVVEERYYDGKGKPTLREDAGGVATIQWDRDAYGYATEARYLGLDGEPKEVKGCAKTALKHNEYGYPLEERYFDCAGNCAERKGEDYGYAIERYKYDDDRNLTELARYGVDGELKGHSLTRIAIIRVSYDSRGRVAQESFHDETGKLFDAYPATALIRFEYKEDDIVKVYSYNCQELLINSSEYKLIEY